MEFGEGDRVEVCSKEEGFVGSYYAATVTKKLGTNKYVVEYKSLLEEDESRPLIETVSGDEVRPVPPRIRFGSGFGLFDKVDAFDNDGWWVGKVTGKRGSIYFVYFETTGDEIGYHISKLRAHLDWFNGKWVSSKNLGLFTVKRKSVY